MLKKIIKIQLNKLARKYNIDTIYLFGSRATGRVKIGSDYDFAVIFNKKVKPKDYSRRKLAIISELLRLVKMEHVDVVALNSSDIPLLLQYNIIKEGKVIYDKKGSGRAAMEAGILIRWLDWQYFEKMWGEIYAGRLAKGKFN